MVDASEEFLMSGLNLIPLEDREEAFRIIRGDSAVIPEDTDCLNEHLLPLMKKITATIIPNDVTLLNANASIGDLLITAARQHCLESHPEQH